MAKKNAVSAVTFDDQLILFRFFLNKLGIESIESLSKKLNSTEFEGTDENGNTYFYSYIARIVKMKNAEINTDKLRLYDENICRHTRQIGEKRGGIVWKYFQYLSLLFTEIYLDSYFSECDAFCAELNAFLEDVKAQSMYQIDFEPYNADKLNKLAFMCATGSGKTLIMHVNILQYLHYFKRAQRLNNHLSINKVIVLAPNEGMSAQHLEELKLSSISATAFQKESGFSAPRESVVVIDMNKLKEEGKVKTVSVDSFEQNNLVLVDEGHRGLSGDVWYDYRTRLSADGFSFEYSATFKQALNANSRKKDERTLMEEYGKSIIMDYSYKYFYNDGYGKDYRIYNMRDVVDDEQRYLYLTGCLLSFYQQVKLYETKKDALIPFNIENPLLVFVGNRVTAPVKSNNLTQAEKELLTDVEEVLTFIDLFVRGRVKSVARIKAVLDENTGLVDGRGNDLFGQNFNALREIFAGDADAQEIYYDMLRLVFNTDTGADEPRLHLESLKQVSGEIGLKVGNSDEFFGVISIGDTAGLMKNCEIKGIDCRTEEFVSESLFRDINKKESKIKVLIGSRKFTEGWNSWRVSTMGLINFAKGEGSQAIQLFGRGVRLKGHKGCLKRSRKLDDSGVKIPKHIEILETLTIFGVKAQYMEDFKRYLEAEGAPTNDNILEFRLPVISRFDEVKEKKLRVIKVKEGINFKKQARRMVLDKPSKEFMRYLLKSKTVIDCRSKIQTIDSTFSFSIIAEQEEYPLPAESIALLDYQRIFEELEQYKNEKAYYNISLIKEKLKDIMSIEGWYSLIIPKRHLEIDSIEKLEAATDYAVMVLKSYMDKFYKFEKERWEAPYLEFAELTENDNNFVDEYTISYAEQGSIDNTGDELEAFIKNMTEILKSHNGLDEYEKTAFRERLVLFDFRNHLYAPLVCMYKSNLKLQISPVSLNEGEKKFVDYLKEYTDKHEEYLADKSLYLLRNKSKVGMGFFEAGNFYPDYILWIDTKDVQYITFIDPKGLLHIKADDPKIAFSKAIKDLEKRLAPTSGDKKVVLNSFIMSSTPEAELRHQWSTQGIDANRAYREERNVYTLDNTECVELMIEKIMNRTEEQ